MPGATARRLGLLDARRGNVTRLLTRVGGAAADFAQGDQSTNAASDDLDRANSLHEREAAAVTAVVLSNTLGQIDDAIRRFEAGSYGVCEDCGHTIPLERLEAWPEATRCVSCQQRDEILAHFRH